MFDIGFIEMLVIGLILLLVVGPERLPEVARTVGGWVHQAKQYMDSMRSELDRDLGISELDRQTRQATSSEGSLDFSEGERSDTDEGEAASGETSASGNGEEGAADRPAGPGEAEAGEAAPESEPAADPDAEDRAASDMERELEEDPKRDDDHRG